MLSSRADTGEKVIKLSDQLTLNLEKSTIFPEELLVHTSVDGTPARYLVNGKDQEANLYHDIQNMASLDVSEEDGLEILGVLGHTLRIKPLPEMERSIDGHIAHMLYHVDEPEFLHGDEPKDYGIPKSLDPSALFAPGKQMPTGPDTLNTSAFVESRSEIAAMTRLPSTIYPEVHVVLDYLLSKAYQFNLRKILRFLAIMANAANLRFRSLRQPMVQIRIVGATVTKTEQEEPYMVRVRGYEETRNILYDPTLWNFTVHVRKHDYFTAADIVFLLTARNLSEWEGSTLVSWVGGYAYTGTACTDWKVGMSEERPHTYYGVYVFTHELAHVLGCMHDGSGPRGWPPGMIGSQDCPWSDGHMMSYEFKVPQMYTFSRCCAREIMNFYNRPNYTCLSHINKKLRREHSKLFPGDRVKWDTFCRKVYYDFGYGKADKEWGAKNCYLKCYYKRGSNLFKYAYAVDGTECGDGKVCILGNCTTRPTIEEHVDTAE
ncbi:A disintegrin and metalloproteinase with thrombospondin motifs 1-like isoform X1 [Dermacentor silvarum]|uniref:A disintegrin and metalloproteinase with thrombospondin motifs 1-like isoform X1 n=1 Tax=Dermacentor silvarum TaxID=543639 RepID=UPI0021014640|nr:A disintegrin and metalloproteinase with thrombospondin motifs 1-like isoform X1 [Dermacentor silvarum]